MRTATKVILIVLGAIAVLVGIAMTIAGGVLLSFDKGRDGFYETGTATVSGDGRAVVSEGLDVTDLPGWLEDRLGTIRITARPGPERRLFLGIGPSAAVDAYLRGVARDRVDSVEDDPVRVVTVRVPGARTPARPATRDFWVAQASGAGVVDLRWRVASGDWTIVMMNADAAPGIRAAVALGATAPFLGTLAWWILIIGIVVLLAGVGLIVWGALLRRRPPGPPATPAGAIPVPPPADPVP
ncbi:MAG: hypothetical protein MUE51_06590 [Thermoleophilia bacterium]|jgi:hypothetical protein|nr:hypothetical protein [Thermoleophilia bacterium]